MRNLEFITLKLHKTPISSWCIIHSSRKEKPRLMLMLLQNCRINIHSQLKPVGLYANTPPAWDIYVFKTRTIALFNELGRG